MSLRAVFGSCLTICMMSVALLAWSAHSPANSGEPFDKMMSQAYSSFRSAYWYSRTNNLGVAALEMMDFNDNWNQLRDSYGDTPPSAYAKDPKWRETLDLISDTNSKALDYANDGNQDDTLRTVVKLRDEFADLRKRNGIVAFSDYVNTLGDLIGDISPYRDWERPLSDDDWKTMGKLADKIDTAIQTVANKASDTLSANDDFVRALDGNRDAMKRMHEHLTKRDERGVKGSIRDLRSAYGLLFLNYG